MNSCNLFNLIFLAPPQSPQLTLSATTTDSLTIKVKKHETDSAPLHGYTLVSKKSFFQFITMIDVNLLSI